MLLHALLALTPALSLSPGLANGPSGPTSGPHVSSGNADGAVDVVSLNGIQLLAWIERLAGTPVTYSVHGVWLDEAGTSLSSPFLIWQSPAGSEIRDLALGSLENPVGPHYVAAWSYDGGADFELGLRLLDPLEVGASGDIQLRVQSGDDVKPDLTKSADTQCTLVWDSQIGVFGAEVSTVFGQLNVANPYRVTLSSATHSPAITRFGDQRFATWIRDGASTPESVEARSWYGSRPMASDRTFTVVTDNTVSSVDCAAGNRDDMLVVYSAGNVSMDVRGKRVLLPQGTNSQERLGPQLDLAATGINESKPKIAFLGDAYLLTYEEAGPANTAFLIGEVLDPAKAQRLELPFSLAFTTTFGGHAVAAHVQGSSHAGTAAWTTTKAFAQDMDGVGGSETRLGGGCSDGGEIRMSAAVSPNTGFAVELWYGPPGAPAYLAVGDSALSLPVGGATLWPDPLVTAIYDAGNVGADGYLELPLSVPAGLVGNSAVLQWLLLDPASCTGFPVNLSSGRSVKVGG